MYRNWARSFTKPLWTGWLCPIVVAAFLQPSVSAQSVSFAIGYTSMRGQIGEPGSDEGLAARLGVDLLGVSHLDVGVEAGIDRLNERRLQSTTICYEVGPCHFDHRGRDTGVFVATTGRIYPGLRRAYGLLGLGYLRVRTHVVEVVTDDQGNPLGNFSLDYVAIENVIQAHVGAGITLGSKRLPVGFFLEGRVTRLFFNYSGGLYGSWNPSVVVGVRTGRG